MNQKYAVEHFHLVFLSFLEKKVDKRLFALKGGCNLRFFFKSIRYSEDIDLDVNTIATGTLKKTVDQILSSQPFSQLLSLQGITIEEFSTPKQTETVQRWKIRLHLEQLGITQSTKIEFSRRRLDSGSQNESIDPLVLSAHHLSLISVPHYKIETALRQKIEALIHRTQTQARDVFDIHWLIQRLNPPKLNGSFSKKELDTAIENAISISYLDFSSQVLVYLDPHHHALYSKEKWNHLLDQVIHFLEELKK